jgi:hypothetical protein
MYHNLHSVVLLLRWEITHHDLFRSRLIEPEEGNKFRFPEGLFVEFPESLLLHDII